MGALEQEPPESIVKIMSSRRSILQRQLASAVLVIWVVFLGFALRHIAKKTTMPPPYDALAYFAKGKNVWEHLNRKDFVSPLNVNPTYRPPGTVLMSFPFGYQDDFHGFYFRCAFIPVLCFMVAVYIAGYSAQASPLQYWALCLEVIFLSSLPFFYNFEYTDYTLHPRIIPVYYWGLVDAFLGAVSALAAAACVQGIRRSSPKWFTLSFILASLCILIKPAGLLTMVVIAGSWFFSTTLQLSNKDPERRTRIRIQLLILSVMLVAIYGFTLLASFKSKYLTPTNLAIGVSAMEVLKADFGTPVTLKTMCVFMYPSLGYVLLICTAILVILGIIGYRSIRFQQDWRISMGLLLSSLLAVILGIWFWLFRTGITQVRFFVPFIMMALVYAVPLSLPIFNHYRKPALIVIAFWCIQIINLALLLVQPAPSEIWQMWSGVYLSMDDCHAEVAQAQELLSQSRLKEESSKVYALDTSASFAPFYSVGGYASLISPDKPSFEVLFPISWQGASVINIHDMVTADYLLFRPQYGSSAKRWLTIPSVKNFEEEKFLFQTALTDFAEQNGVQKISETSVRLLKITDRVKLLRSLEALQWEHSWPAAFDSINSKECSTQQDLQNVLLSQAPVISGVIYDDKFEIRALQMERNNGNTNLHLWWRRLADDDGENWKLFIHEVDKNGDILSNREIGLRDENQCLPDSPLRDAILSFPTYTKPPAWGIAVGFYRRTQTGDTLLHARSGIRDWGNTRVLIAYDSAAKN